MNQPAIQTLNLVRRYGKHIAVNNLNLSIEPGTIYGFIGPNGAGKTTTMRMLAGLLEPTSGTVTLNGRELRRNGQIAHRMVGYMPDFFGVYDDLRVWEYLDFYARCHNIDGAQRRTTVDGLLDLVDLSAKREAFVQHLSRGMQQRLCLAHALVHDPPILLLDEPASGLDPQARIELRELLRTLRDMGKTIILSSHILTELQDICTDVGIIANGRLLASGPLDDLQRAGTQKLRIRLLDDVERAARLLAAQDGVKVVHPPDENAPTTLVVDFEGDDERAAAILAGLARAELNVADFHRE
ncbi:MAG TPA: ABC transporter ATP-binding protein, partial [Herpetosiphonaceae bacterium]|nr:ABC transporter ATP-binding protein [Herpetosiphonaceae bacterium]